MTKIDLLIETELLPPQFHWNPRQPERGTEKFYVQTALAAVQDGLEVVVVGDFAQTMVLNGVTYQPRREDLPDSRIRVICNPTPNYIALHHDKSVKADHTILWTNFAMGPNPDGYLNGVVPHIRPDEIVVISEYHRQAILAATNRYKPHDFRVVGHGVDKTVYHPPRVERDREQIVAYTSSPDRGLDYLRRLWDEEAIEDQTGYKLVATKYAEGAVTDHQVADLLRRSTFWVHPGMGTELFCLSAVEAQACGSTPIVVPNGALRETVRYGYCFPEPFFKEGLLSVLYGGATIQNIDAAHIPDWMTVTRQLLAI